MKPPLGVPVYDTIGSQRMVQYMWRYALHIQATQIPCSVAFDEPLDFSLLARAVNEEIARNDCLRLRVFRQGTKIKQFFLPEYRLEKILLKEFHSPEEQNAFFNADGSRKLDVFRGETFRVIFFRTHDGKCGVYLNINHMVMDAVGTFIFFNDLMAVYDSLKAGTPLPRPMAKYEDVIRKELEDPDHAAFVEREGKLLDDWVVMDRPPTYCALNGPKDLDKYRRLLHRPKMTMPPVYMPLFDEARLLKLRLSPEDSAKMDAFITENRLSPEWLIQLGLRVNLSRLNRRVNDTLFWVLCPRRKTVKEKRCGGTMASPMPWREILPEHLTFRQGLAQLAETQAFLFRHSDVPYLRVRESEIKQFHLTLLQSPNSMMFSYLPLAENTLGGRPYAYNGYSIGHYVIPVYTLATKDAATGCYVISYIYRTHIYTEGEVRAFHDGAVKTILKGIRSPEKTLGQIMEEI